jgi:hypothetical protein
MGNTAQNVLMIIVSLSWIFYNSEVVFFSEELPVPSPTTLKAPKEPLAVRRRLQKPPKTPKTTRAKTKSESEGKTPDITDYLGKTFNVNLKSKNYKQNCTKANYS